MNHVFDWRQLLIEILTERCIGNIDLLDKDEIAKKEWNPNKYIVYFLILVTPELKKIKDEQSRSNIFDILCKYLLTRTTYKKCSSSSIKLQQYVEDMLDFLILMLNIKIKVKKFDMCGSDDLLSETCSGCITDESESEYE